MVIAVDNRRYQAKLLHKLYDPSDDHEIRVGLGVRVGVRGRVEGLGSRLPSPSA